MECISWSIFPELFLSLFLPRNIPGKCANLYVHCTLHHHRLPQDVMCAATIITVIASLVDAPVSVYIGRAIRVLCIETSHSQETIISYDDTASVCQLGILSVL